MLPCLEETSGGVSGSNGSHFGDRMGLLNLFQGLASLGTKAGGELPGFEQEEGKRADEEVWKRREWMG